MVRKYQKYLKTSTTPRAGSHNSAKNNLNSQCLAFFAWKITQGD